MINQLRIYEIPGTHCGPFHDRFRDMHEVEMCATWDAFMAEDEWAEIERMTAARHGVFINGIKNRSTSQPIPSNPSVNR